MDDTRYEAPAVEDRTPVEAPLNTTAVNSQPLPPTPAWRRTTEET